MAYPAQPSPFIRSGWVASQLLPNPDFHAGALTYLGGGRYQIPGGLQGSFMGSNPASNPSVSGVPQVSGQTLQTPPNSLGSNFNFGDVLGTVGGIQPSQNFPSWMTSLLSQMGLTPPTGQPNQPNSVPTGAPALTQLATQPPAGSGFNTPQFWSTAKKKKHGLFSTVFGIIDPIGKQLGVTDTVGKVMDPMAKYVDPLGNKIVGG